jgi:hypothetical protein
MPERPYDSGRRLDLAEILEFFRRLEPSEHSINKEQRIRLRYQFYSLRRKLNSDRFLSQRWKRGKMQINPRSTFPRERFPDLVADLVRRNDEIFLLETMLSADSGEILGTSAHIP